MKIILLGIKHVGKSSLAESLSKILRLPYFDLDQIITEHQNNLPIREIYQKLGKIQFDKLQGELLSYFLNHQEEFILALGGGICDIPSFSTVINQENYCKILLKGDFSIIFERIKAGGLPPFLKEGSKDPYQLFTQIMKKRETLYEKVASIKCNCHNKSIEEISNELKGKIKKFYER